jgi:hypothetical protein
MSDDRPEWNAPSGCTQFTRAPPCGCGEYATRLTGLCERCWKQRPAWPEIFENRPAHAMKADQLLSG